MTILAILLTAILHSTPITHTDDFPPEVMAAAFAADTGALAIECNQPLTRTVQFVWRSAPGETPDREAIEAQLHTIAERVSWMFWRDSDSWTEARIPAWKMTDDCKLDVAYIESTERIPEVILTKQIVIEQSVSYCGRAILFSDVRPSVDNFNNLSSTAWVARRCLAAYVVAHEFLHSIGAVQSGAPHSDGGYHATDYGDVMATWATPRCPRSDTIDCGKDDYFSLQPTGYLANYWNSADSLFLRTVPKYTYILMPVFYKGTP